MEGLVQRTTEDEEFRSVVRASGVAFVDGAAQAISQDIFLDNFTSSGKNFLPQDFGYWFELVFSANYSSTASVLSEWSHNMWLAVNENKDFDSECYYDGWYYWCDDGDHPADYWETFSQASAIVAKTTFLSNSTVQSDGSAVGNMFSSLPIQIQQTLGDKKTMAAFASDCITLSARFKEANYEFCYSGDDGDLECKNYNSNVGQITSGISKVCRIIKDSTVY
jgi:hypothetical protein